MSSSLGFGDSVGGISFGPGVLATDAFGNTLSVYDGTQRVTIHSSSTTILDYAKLTNKPQLFSGDFNDLTNKPVLLQGVPGQSIIGERGLPGVDGSPGRDGVSIIGPAGRDGISITGPRGLPGQSVQGPKGDTGSAGAASTIPGPKGDTGSAGAASTIPGPKGDTGSAGAASTVAGPKGDPGSAGPAPTGTAGSVVFLTSSGVADATANLVITSSNITSLLPIISNITAGSSSTIPAATIVGTVSKALTVVTPAQSNITSPGTLTGLNMVGTIYAAGTNSAGTQALTLLNSTVSNSWTLQMNGSSNASPGSFSILNGLLPSNPAITFQQSTGYVGILKNIPQHELDVSGTISSNSYIGSVATASQPLITTIGTLTGLKVSGFVGVGTSTPSSILHVEGVAPRITLQGITGTSNPLGIDVLTTASASVPSCQLQFQDDGATSSHMSFNTKNSSNVLVNRLFIKSSGFLGINNSNPQYQLDINGSCNATSFTGDGSALTNINAGAIAGTVQTSNICVNVSGASQPAITSVGTLTSLTVASNITSTNMTCSNLLTTQLLSVGFGGSCQVRTMYGLSANLTNYVLTSNLTVSNLATVSTLTVTNACTASSFAGDGSSLTSLNGSNVTGVVANSTNAVSVSGSSQPAITSLGYLSNLNIQSNVGIGTNSPVSLLHIEGVNPRLTLNNTNGTGAHVGIDVLTYGNEPVPGAQIDFYDSNDYSSHIYFNTKSPGGASNPLVNRLFIQSSGKVGVNTTSPVYQLDVAGTCRATAFIGDGSQLTNLPTYSGTLNLSTSLTVGSNISGFAGVFAGPQTLFSPSSSSSSYTGDPGNGQMIIANSSNTNYRLGICVDPTAGRVGTYLQSMLAGVGPIDLQLQTSGGSVGIGLGATPCGANLDCSGTIRGRSTVVAGVQGSAGCVKLQQGGANNTGYVEFLTASGTRAGYIGYGGSTNILQLETENGFYGYNFSSNVYIASKLSVGGSPLAPNMFSLYGADSNINGPHLIYKTNTDFYGLFQQLNWAHDNIAMNFDCSFNGSDFINSNATAYQIYKIAGSLYFNYGVATVGSSFPKQTAMIITQLGRIGIGTTSPTATLEVNGTSKFNSDMTTRNILPVVDNFAGIGNPSLRYTYVYAVNGTIQTSDSRTKTAVPLTYGLAELMRVNTINF